MNNVKNSKGVEFSDERYEATVRVYGAFYKKDMILGALFVMIETGFELFIPDHDFKLD